MLPWWPLLELLSRCPIFKSSHCNTFEDQGTRRFHLRVPWSSNELQRLDNMTGYQDCNSINSHQGDIPYYVQSAVAMISLGSICAPNQYHLVCGVASTVGPSKQQPNPPARVTSRHVMSVARSDPASLQRCPLTVFLCFQPSSRGPLPTTLPWRL